MTFDTPWNDTLQTAGYQHLNMTNMTFDTPWDGPSAGQIDGLASSVETSTLFTENISSAPIATAPRAFNQLIPIEIAPLDSRWNGHLVAPGNSGTPLPSGYQLLDMSHVTFDTPWNGPPVTSAGVACNRGTTSAPGYQLLDMAHMTFDTPWNGPPAVSVDLEISSPAAEAPSSSFA